MRLLRIIAISAIALLIHSCSKKSEFLKGVEESSSGNYNKAIELFSSSIAKDPFKSESYFERGKAKGFLGFYKDAVIDLNRAIELDAHPAYLNTRSAVYSSQENYELAIQDATRAIELKEDFQDAYYNRASALFEISEYDKAISDYSKVLEMDPTNSLGYFVRGVAHQRSGDMDDACKDWEQALQLGSNDAKSYLAEYCD